MAWVTGRVVSATGTPVPGATVGDARRSLNVVTDRNGRYFLPVVRGARTVLSVLKPGFAPRTVVTSIAGLTGAADDAVLVATQPAALTESGSDRWFAVSGVPVRVLVPEGADVTGLQVRLAWYDHNDHFPEVMPEPAWVAGVHVTANAPLPAGTVLEVTTAYGLPVATAIPGWRFAGDGLGFGATPLSATAQVQSGSPSAVIRVARAATSATVARRPPPTWRRHARRFLPKARVSSSPTPAIIGCGG